MSKSSPEVVYRHLCDRLRVRIEFAEITLNSAAPEWQIVEIASLQGRKAVETISHMCLVATEHGFGELGIPRDAKMQWNAETVFESLRNKKIEILPSPSRMKLSDDPRYKAVFACVPENRLTYDDLIAIYRLFHEGLHDANPYRGIEKRGHFKNMIPEIGDAIARIRKFVWVHYIGIKGRGFGVDLKNTRGVTTVAPMSQIGEMPWNGAAD
jgi:hypothetical protein